MVFGLELLVLGYPQKVNLFVSKEMTSSDLVATYPVSTLGLHTCLYCKVLNLSPWVLCNIFLGD